VHSESVTEWFEELKQGNEEAAARLWERYFEKMVQAARGKLWPGAMAVTDEEDVALSAFDSLCRGAAAGNFEQFSGRQALWPLLLTITAQKAVDRIRWERRERRGGGKVARESELRGTDQAQLINEILARGPTPEFLVLMDEEYARLLSQLPDKTLRDIVQWKLEGLTHERIGGMLGVSVHTVGRKLRLIRQTWSREFTA
jgi:DNA-directed RNA polymerase specialized sigma24 family protein